MMARADLICDLIKYGIVQDSVNFRKASEAICAEERSKQHTVLAKKIEEILQANPKNIQKENTAPHLIKNGFSETALFWEKMPKKRLEHLVLPDTVTSLCKELIEEQLRSDILRSYGMEPRNRILLVGEPGNGKTSLAEAIAESLMLPILTVRYESIIGSYLGETASRLAKLFEYVKTRQCVLFFDEFETLGKERGDIHETGEIKRVVSSLLLYIDSLPSYVIAIAATNHDSLLDKAAWRRFQIKMELPRPTRSNLEVWFKKFEKQKNFNFGLQVSTLAKKVLGLSYSEAEELALAIYRQYILKQPTEQAKSVTNNVLKLWETQLKHAKKSQQNGDDSECQNAQ